LQATVSVISSSTRSKRFFIQLRDLLGADLDLKTPFNGVKIMFSCFPSAVACRLRRIYRAMLCVFPLLLAACSAQTLSSPGIDSGLQLAADAPQTNRLPAAATADETVEPAEYGNKPACNRPYNVKGHTYYPLKSAHGYKAQGLASWYGAESGNRTASGSRFNPKALSAAHKTLPIPSKVRVTNLRNGRFIDVLINDRGPFNDNKIIDLSKGAAEQIGMRGLTEVQIEYLGS
jgi:rare lipoprotein A